MICKYGVTLDGTYHIKKVIPNQDAYAIEKCSDDMFIAAVADGLGSAEHSEIASRLAADISTTYCKKNITPLCTADSIIEVIKASFAEAQKAIEKKAEEQSHPIEQYDTTLSLAVFINDTLYYGHSGDSGIVALTVDGLYEKVTEQQRDEDGKLFPLFFEDRWEFDKFDKKVCSVFLATDGIYETLFPSLIRNLPVNIHVNLARYFMDNRSLQIDKVGESAVEARIEDFLRNIPDEQVNDDKTVVVLVNASIESKLQPDDYYTEPNWTELKQKHDEEWKRMAYPHLFKDKDISESHKNNPVEKEEKSNDADAEQHLHSPDEYTSNNETADTPATDGDKEPQKADHSEGAKKKGGLKEKISEFVKRKL